MKWMYPLFFLLSSCASTVEYRKKSDATLMVTGGVVGGSFIELGRVHNENFEYGLEAFSSYVDDREQNGLYAKWYLGNSFFLKLGAMSGSVSRVYRRGDFPNEIAYQTRTTYVGPSIGIGHRWIFLRSFVLGFDYLNMGVGVQSEHSTTVNGEKVETPEEFEKTGGGGSVFLLGLGLII